MLAKLRAEEKWISRSSVICILFLLAFIFLMQSPLNVFLMNGNTGTDSSVFKTIALCMEKGLMPYKDSFDHKGPLLYIYNWLGMQIAYWRGIWIIEFVSLFTCFFFMYRMARIVCGRFFALLAVTICSAPLYLYFEGGNLTEEYALPFLAGALYIFANYFVNHYISKARLIMCGLSFGAVCLLRINMISVWLVFCIAVLLQCLHEKEGQKILFFLKWFVTGTLLIIVPIFLWLIAKGAFEDFVIDYFIFNHLYIKATALGRYNSFMFFANNSYVILATVISVYMCKQKKIFYISYLAYIFVTLAFICVSGQTFSHYGMVLVPMLVYPISLLLSKADIKEKNGYLFFVLYIMLAQVTPAWISGVNKAAEYYFQEDITSARVDTTGKVVEYVVSNSEENEKIIVWGNWDIIYALSKRLPASKYSYQFPIGKVDNRILADFFDELKENFPKIIVISSDLGDMEQFLVENNYICTADIDGVAIYMQNAKLHDKRMNE